MIVRAIHDSYEGAPSELLNSGAVFPESQTDVTAGKCYEVHAICVFESFVHLMIVGNSGVPWWQLSWLFEVVDEALPSDWRCNLFDAEPSMVIGPEFISGSLDSYVAMAELHREQVDRFWARLAQRTDEGSDTY